MNGLEVAIVGMSCRCPGAPNVAAFWRLLRDGVESISFFTDGELRAAGVSPRRLQDPQYVRARGVLDDIELFDAEFFGFTRQEAELADPQQRMFLECAWEALEDAGCDPAREHRPVGVYAGSATSAYLLHLFQCGVAADVVLGPHAMYGNEHDYLPTRVAYKLGLKGPAVGVQTACSTSLVAVHLACQGLLSGDCDLALAGGASVSVPQRVGYVWEDGGITSHDGHCRAFDASASGTVHSSGVGVVVLKRLTDALEDRDRIHAVIKGSAINNDGAEKIGYTAPSVAGQVAVIRTAQLRAEMAPGAISCVETHGTGTALGDPIEIAALTEAFGEGPARAGRCALGALKTNIGHLDAAAGVAGLIKTALALEHRLIPATLHFKAPNPQIDFARTPFYVPTTLTPWDRDGGRLRCAAVSALGIGGTNAHVVLEEAPAVEAAAPGRGLPVLTLGAKSPEARRQMVANLSSFLRDHPDTDLFDAAYTLHVGRGEFPHRAAAVCRDSDGPACLEHDTVYGTARPDVRAAFVFPGQGVERTNAGRRLYGEHSVFRSRVDRCAELLAPHLGFDLRDVLFPDPRQAGEAERRIATTAVAQPALFVVEYALAELWRSWGVRPAGLIGHSLGEYVAACLSEVLSLEDALRVVSVRGRMMQEALPGAMLAVGVGRSDVERLLQDGLCLAAVNSQSLSVVSGPAPAVDRLERRLGADRIYRKRLLTCRAFHSSSMDAVVPRFVRFMSTVTLRPPSMPYVSCVTGTWAAEAESTSPDYWGRQLRAPVMFWEGLNTLVQAGCSAFLEVGPASALLSRAVDEIDQSVGAFACSSLSAAAGSGDDGEALHRAVAELWVHGVSPDWNAYHAGERRWRVPVPTYPFQRQRFWLDGNASGTERSRTHLGPPPPPDDLHAQSGAAAATSPADAVDVDVLLMERQVAVMQAQLRCWGGGPDPA